MPSFYGGPYTRDPLSIEEFARRFDGAEVQWIRGRDIWSAWLIERVWQEDPDGAIQNLIRRLLELEDRPLECPRVFVSHRWDDTDNAMRVGWLASKSGFQFWIDALDPKLQFVASLGAPLLAPAKAALIASIIELALLNCSHVIALLTDKSRGSLWIPYEYGRVKTKRMVRTRNAAVWLSPDLASADDPEYTILGVRTSTENEISFWFFDELSKWRAEMSRCFDGAQDGWAGVETQPLKE